MGLQIPQQNPLWKGFGQDREQESSDLLDVAEQLVDGFIGGFTTFEVGEQPKDDFGQMARSLGHLAGFIGFIPGMGSLGSYAAKGLRAATGIKGIKNTATAAKMTAFAPKVGQFKSVPMLGADLFMKGAEKAGAGKAFKLATDFAAKEGISKGTIEGISYALEGGLHLGVASGVSSWQHGIDAMTDSFIHGAVAGGVFRALGQALPNAPGRTPTGNVIDNFKQILIDPATGKFSPDGQGVTRVLASSMFTGLPATLQGQSTPLQVYEYLLGAVFGAGEMSKPDRDALKWINEEPFKATKGTNSPIQMGHMALLEPELLPSFKELSPKAQEIVKSNLLMRSFGMKNLLFQFGGSEYETSSSYGGLELAKLINKSLPEIFNSIRIQHKEGLIDNAEYDRKMGVLQQAVGTAKLNRYYINILKGVKGSNARLKKGEVTEAQQEEAWDKARKRVAQEVIDALNVERAGYEDAANIVERHKYETVEGKVHTEFTEIMQEIKENAPPFINPSEAIGNAYYTSEVAKKHIEEADLSNTTRTKHIIEVANVINKGLTEKVSFDKLRVAIEKATGLEVTKPRIDEDGFIHDNALYRNLRRAYKSKDKTNVPVSELVYSKEKGTWTIVEAKNVNSKGQRISQWKHRQFIKELLGDDVYFSNLKQIKFGKQDFDLYDLKDVNNQANDISIPKKLQEITPAEIIYRLFSPEKLGDKKTLFIGAKDNSNIFVVSFLEGARTPEEAIATRNQVYRLLRETEGETSAELYAGRLEERLEAFLKSAKITGRGENHREIAKTAFMQQYANSMLMMAKINGMELSDYITKSRAVDANGKPLYNFITSPTALNKRGSLLNNGFDRVDPTYFTDVADVKDGNLKIVFSKDTNTKGQDTEGKENIKRYIDDGKGNIIEIDHMAHKDGFFKLRDDIYERLSIQAGLELETGSQKGTLVHSAQDGQGLVLGKYAYHKASKAESDAMRAQEVHGIMPESAAKQVGTRELADVSWNTKENAWTIEGKSHEIPIESFTTTEGGEHAHLTLQDKRVLSQMMSGLRGGTHDKARQELKDIVNDNFKGSSVENEKVQKHLGNPASVDAKDINIEQLSAQSILDIMYSGKNTPLYQKTLREIASVIRNREFVRDAENSPEIQAEMDVMAGHKRSAEELMLLWDGMLTPGIMNNKMISKYFNNSVKYYLINKISQPKIPGSFDSILQPYYGEITGKIDLKPGEIILSKRHAELEIPWIGGELKKTKEAFEEYKALLEGKNPDKEKLAEMEESLSWVFQRVPTDSPSGIRVLKIKGFQEVEGSGVVMHPEDMENIGGADLDIDKVYGFTRFSKGFKDDIRSTMYEWYKDGEHNGKKVRVLTDAKQNDFFKKESDDAPIKYTKVNKIESDRKRAVVARRLPSGEILLNERLLKRRYTQKAWTKPAVKGVKPLPEDYFKTYEEWKQFVLRHEKAHEVLPKLEGEERAGYENRINRRALIQSTNSKKDYWNMFDASTMYEVNESATRGNRLLDPGIGSTKIMEGVAEYLQKSKDHLVINLNGKGTKLKYKDLDLETFRLAKRALINRAADAADGENLKSAPEVVQELWDILTKGKGGSFSEARKDNDIIGWFSQVNRVKNGGSQDINTTLNTANSTAAFRQNSHNNSLGFIQESLLKKTDELGLDIENIPSPYFQALHKVSGLNFKKYRDLPFLSSNIKAQAEKLERALKTVKDIDAILGIQKGSEAKDDPFGFKAFGNFKETDLYKLVKSISPSEADQLYREIFSQDASDLTSTFLLRYYLPKEYEREMLVSIHKKVASFKKELFQSVEESKASLAEHDHSNIEAKLGEIDKLREIYLEDIPKKYHNFFHAATLSSISHQPVTLGEFIKETKSKLNKEYRQKMLEIKNSDDVDFMKGYERKNFKESWLARRAKALNNAKADWHATNISDLPFRLNTIPSDIKIKFGELYNETIQKVDAKVPDDKLLDLEGYAYNKYVTEEMQYPSSKRVSHDFLKLSMLIGGKSSEQLPVKFKRELEAIQPLFTEALVNNPDYLVNIDAMFTGFMADKAGMGGYGFLKTPRMSTAQDVLEFAKEIVDIHQKKGKPLDIGKRHWFMNRKKVAKELSKYEGRFVTEFVLAETPEKKGWAEVRKLESFLGDIGKLHNQGQIHGDAQRSIIEKDYETSIAKRVERALNKLSDGLGSKLYELAMDEHQMPLGNKSQKRVASEIDKALKELNTKETPTVFIKDKQQFTLRQAERNTLTAEQIALLETATNSVTNRHTDEYVKRAELTAEERAKLKLDKTKYKIPVLGEEMTAEKIMEWYKKDEKIWASKVLNEIASNAQKVESFLSEPRASEDRILDAYGYIRIPQLAKALARNMKLGKPEFYSLDLLDRIRHQLMLDNVTLNPIEFFRRQLKGGPDELPAKVSWDDLEASAGYKKLVAEFDKNNGVKGADKYTNTMFKIYREMIRTKDTHKRVKTLPTRELMDQTWEYLKKTPLNTDNNGWMEYKAMHERLPDWWKDHYHPHTSFNEAALTRQLFKKIVRAMEGKSDDLSQVEVMAGQLKEDHLIESKAREEGNITEAAKILELSNMETGITESNVRDLLLTFTSSLERNRTEPVAEWQNKLENRLLYERGASRNYWASITGFIGEQYSTDFHNSGALGSTTKYWTKYLKTFNQQMVNGNSMMPLINRGDPNMGLKYNPYTLLTDEYWKEKIKYVESKMFNGEKLFKEYTDLTPEQIKEITNDKVKMGIAQDLYYHDASTKLAMMSNLEAKYELMTLLSHPKSFINNMIGGNLNTLSNIGTHHFKNAMDVSYLKENVFLDFNSRDDVLRFVEEMGGIEAMFTAQFGLDPLFKTHKYSQMVDKVFDYFKSGEKYSEKSMRELFKESGISDALMNTAGWFMKESEVRLRSRAWMAHYLNARQTLDATGFVLQQDHPWLIQWANKGVEATQFLYNNANRAPFARTHLGKVFSRFQLWAWNSLGFRRNVMAQAHEAGWEEGSAEFKRLQRLITADVFIFALAKAFAMSTFDNTLPPPLSYLADFGQFFFGEEEEKRRAFYGVLPYPANVIGVTAPPITRIPFGVITALSDGSLDEMSHRVTSWIPFGRVGSSAARTVKSPERLLQNFTGFPLDKISGYANKIGEYENRTPLFNDSDTLEAKKN